MIYFIVFSISVFFTYLAEKVYNNRMLFILLSAIVLLLPSLLAGVRDITIGTDTMSYPIRSYYMALENNSWANYYSFEGLDILYLLLTFGITLLTKNFAWVLFSIQFFIITLFYLTSIRYKKIFPMWFFMLLYFFLLYNTSLNITRQCLALAICLYGYSFLEKGERIKYILFIILASGFHRTAIFSLILIPLKNSELFQKKAIRIALILFATIALFLYNPILRNFVQIGLIPEKFLIYSGNSGSFESFFSYSEFSLRIFVLFLLLSLKNKNLIEKKTFTFFLFIFFIEFIINLSQIYSRYANRIAYYLFILYYIYLPQILFSKQLQRGKKEILVTLTITFVIFYWIYVFIVSNAGETYPYKSKILGI